MRTLIITADDFGLAIPVNEAIEEAHRRGVLTTASLMIGAADACDAVERATRLPSLNVGLHLVLVEGRPILPPQAVPDLVDTNGEFSCRLVLAGIKFFFRPRVRRQLEAEIRAQFEAFRKTGLSLDHINAHNHIHLHPTVLSLILKVGREYGLKAVRVPYEPFLPSWRASRSGFLRKFLASCMLLPWVSLLKWRLRQAGLCFNDYVFGLHDSGRLRRDLVIRFLRDLPDGVTEIYFHPAIRACPEIDRTMADYCHEAEFESLISSATREAVAASGAQSVSFSGLRNGICCES